MTTFTGISQEVWKSSVPIELVIAENDLSSTMRPYPCFLLISRMSYLGVVAADSVDFLKSYAIDLDSDIWFESDGCPLKCNTPVGILFDLHCSQTAVQPWRIVVHFRDFPSDKILKCNTREAAEKMYMHTLKQALFVLQGNTRSFNAMVLEQQQMLWEASNSGSGGLFESVAADLRGCEVTKSVPVRVFYKKRNEEIDAHDIPIKCDVDISRINDGDNLKLQNNASTTVCYQRPVQIFNAQKGGVETLLLDVLVQYLPNIFPHKMTSPQQPTVLVHGIDVPLNTPILQLWKSCAHADFFLYIIVLN